MADEDDGLAGDQGAELLDPPAAPGGTEEEGKAERAVRREARELRVARGIRGLGEVVLVDRDRSCDATVGESDQEAIEQAGGERRLAQRGDDHREVDVGCQNALAVDEQRIRA